MSERVLVGGTHDGERVRCEEQYLRMPVKHYVKINNDNGSFETEEYQLAELFGTDKQGRSKTFPIYILHGMSYAEALWSLIDGYRRP